MSDEEKSSKTWLRTQDSRPLPKKPQKFKEVGHRGDRITLDLTIEPAQILNQAYSKREGENRLLAKRTLAKNAQKVLIQAN